MAQSGYLQGRVGNPETGSTTYSKDAEGSAAKVEDYATEAKTQQEAAKAAAEKGDANGLKIAASKAQTAADNAQTAYDEIATYIENAEIAAGVAERAYDAGVEQKLAAETVVDSAEAAYNSRISKAKDSDWIGAFEAKEAWKACEEDIKTGSDVVECLSLETDYTSLKWYICEEYYGTNYQSKCGMYPAMYNTGYDFEDIFTEAKSLYNAWQDAKADYEASYTADYLTELKAIDDEMAAELASEQAFEIAAKEDLNSAKLHADIAASYVIETTADSSLACTSLTLIPSSHEMAATDTEAAFDITVSLELAEEESLSAFIMDGIKASLLAIKTDGAKKPDGSSTPQDWQGTLVFKTPGAGVFTYTSSSSKPVTANPLNIDLTSDKNITVSFSGGVAGDPINVSIDGSKKCTAKLTITQAAAVVEEVTDTDGDGLSDKAEIKKHGTDPALVDTDEDGVSDGDEVTAGTDPTVNEATLSAAEAAALAAAEAAAALALDTDGDGLTDIEEVDTYDTDTNDSDTDNDTHSDGAEVAAGTDPLDANDYPGVVVEDPVDPIEPSDEVPTLTRDIILANYTCTDSFTDNDGEWHEDIICRAQEAGWVKGYSTLIFGPDGNITRAEYVKVLTKIFGLDEQDGYSGNVGFTDVSPNDWHYPYINLAENEDWIRTRDSGYSFNPNTPVTRADAILWAIRAAGEGTFSYDVEASFSDVENDDYFAYALAIANSTLVDTADDTDQPIVEGYSNGTFGPYKNIARSEAMAIATRVAIAWGVASEGWDE